MPFEAHFYRPYKGPETTLGSGSPRLCFSTGAGLAKKAQKQIRKKMQKKNVKKHAKKNSEYIAPKTALYVVKAPKYCDIRLLREILYRLRPKSAFYVVKTTK